MSKKEKTNGKRKIGKTILKILGIVAAIVAVLSVIGIIANAVSANANLKLAESFKAVENEERIVPEFKDGYWTFTTDRDLKIIQLTDVHIGGGWMSAKRTLWLLTP